MPFHKYLEIRDESMVQIWLTSHVWPHEVIQQFRSWFTVPTTKRKKEKKKLDWWKSCENLVNTNLSTPMVHSFSRISRDLQGVQPQKSEPMAVHGLLKGVTGSDLDLGAHRILKFKFNGSNYLFKISCDPWWFNGSNLTWWLCLGL